MVKTRFILQDIKKIDTNKDFYPTRNDIENGGSSNIPESLRSFLQSLFLKNQTIESLNRKVVGIANAIIQVAAPLKYMSPLLFSLGVFMHRKFDSRELIELTSSLGFSISYSEVLNFERCTIVTPAPLPDPSTSVQYVFDNADINIDTVDGKGTFHQLGGLMIITPKFESQLMVKRIKTSENIENIGSFGVLPIHHFSKEKTGSVRRNFTEKQSTVCFRVTLKSKSDKR